MLRSSRVCGQAHLLALAYPGPEGADLTATFQRFWSGLHCTDAMGGMARPAMAYPGRSIYQNQGNASGNLGSGLTSTDPTNQSVILPRSGESWSRPDWAVAGAPGHLMLSPPALLGLLAVHVSAVSPAPGATPYKTSHGCAVAPAAQRGPHHIPSSLGPRIKDDSSAAR